MASTTGMDRVTKKITYRPSRRSCVSIFRFTIRDVLWLTVVVALACGWWLERNSMMAQLAKRDLELSELRAIFHEQKDFGVMRLRSR